MTWAPEGIEVAVLAVMFVAVALAVAETIDALADQSVIAARRGADVLAHLAQSTVVNAVFRLMVSLSLLLGSLFLVGVPGVPLTAHAELILAGALLAGWGVVARARKRRLLEMVLAGDEGGRTGGQGG